MGSPHWIAAVLETPDATWDVALDFWSAATGWRPTPTSDVVVLTPADGDPILALRRAGGETGLTLDVHVRDVAEAAELAARLGAGPGFTSPGGLPFRLVESDGRRRPAPTVRPGGASLVDQVAIDAPASAWAEEVAFWSALTGWPTTVSSAPHLAPLHRPVDVPFRLMVQRLGADDGRAIASAHLDIASSDRHAEAARHETLGARVEAVRGHWTVLRAPDGRRYCLTGRDPFTGLLPPV